jgi:hypothetical protein
MIAGSEVIVKFTLFLLLLFLLIRKKLDCWVTWNSHVSLACKGYGAVSLLVAACIATKSLFSFSLSKSLEVNCALFVFAKHAGQV